MKVIRAISVEDSDYFDEVHVGHPVLDTRVSEIRFNRNWFDIYNEDAGKFLTINALKVTAIFWANEGEKV